MSRPSTALLSAAYGTDSYGCGNYQSNEACSVEPIATVQSSPLAPLSGFLEQPPIVTVPVLLLIAITLASVTYAISRALAKKRT